MSEQVLFSKNEGGEYVSFEDDGQLYVSTFSYYSCSYGDMELDKTETRALFDAMAEYYKKKDELAEDVEKGAIAHG